MHRVPSWLVAMFSGLLGVAALGALGAPSLVALLGGVAVGLLAHRSRRDPPWTAAGRRRWREAWRSAAARARVLWRAWRQRSARSAGPVGNPFGNPFGGGRRAPPDEGWPGGPGSSWREPGSDVGAEVASDGEGRGSLVSVRCEVVTDRLQVWHSTDTGRAYEVAAERGLIGASPGDLGSLTFEGGRPRVVRRAVN